MRHQYLLTHINIVNINTIRYRIPDSSRLDLTSTAHIWVF